MSNIEIGSLKDNYFHIGSTGKTEPTDTYFFSLPTMGSARISAVGFSGDINMELREKEGRLIKSISTSDKNPVIISIDNLEVADYILNVSPVSGNTNYQVSLTPDGKVDPLTGMGVEAGFFTPDQKGEVGFDLLHDGGRYKGEVAIFSLDGMEEFTSDSQEFIKEASKRALSDSVLGHIVISESTEGANPEFRGSLGDENYNNEPYKGIKTFTMIPGKAFAVMLVPNGKVQEVFDNPDIGGDKHPLFSLSSSNPNDAWLYGQIADITGAGQAFPIENQRVDVGSDRDYEDIIFKLTGATGKAVLLKEVIDPAKDWTTSEGGNKLIDFLTLNPAKDTAPHDLQFELELNSTIGEAIELKSGKVADTNGVIDIARIDLSLRREGGQWTNLEDAANFIADSQGFATFSYSLPALAIGTYELKAIAYDREGATSNTVLKSFTVNEATVTSTSTPTPTPTPTPIPTPINRSPENSQFSLSTTYKPNEAIQLTNAKVFDTNGAHNLEKVDFGLQEEGGEWTDISDATTFIPDSLDNRWATFDYTLNGLTAGKDQLKASAYDRAGAASNEVLGNLFVNTAPGDLQFRILPLYTKGEKISFSGAKVFDSEGVRDIAKVDFWFQTEGGERIEIANDVTEFTSDSDGLGRFNFSADLSSLAPGRYQLSAIAYDRADSAISEASEKFALISDPGPDGLSDEVRLAIVGAANLKSYPREALAATTEWVVWVTPGQSSRELAAKVGAIDRGGTGQIPNTFIWKFREGSSPEEVAAQLKRLSGVEYAYPQVPVKLNLLDAPNDTLYPQQWNLANANVPAAWNVTNPTNRLPVRGRGVTIAIVDDGLERNHPDLANRYSPSLSWDFTDGDDNPSPSSITRFIDPVLSPQGNSGNSIKFDFPVTFTGMVKDVEHNFDFTQSLLPNLPQPQQLEVLLSSPKIDPFNPFYRRASFGVRRWWPGRNHLELRQVTAALTGNTSTPSFPLNQGTFYKTSVGGIWELEIKNPDPSQYDSAAMQLLGQELLEHWKLKIRAANPHGTAVAGIAAASENGQGIVGVAPEARLAGIRLLGKIDPLNYEVDPSGQEVANALFDPPTPAGVSNRNQSIDIFNNSWGPEYLKRQPLALAALESGVTKGRKGLGNTYVFAGGNEGNYYGNVNYNSFASSRHAIAVAAIDRAEKHAPYSTPGAAIFISAPSDNGAADNSQGITTTDILESQPPYANDFGGTSAAAPLVSGVIALMLEANPNLTTRDIQHILVRTAYRNDPSGQYENGQPKWQQNGVQRWVSYEYGFGAIDAAAAVQEAVNWTPVGNEVSVTSGLQDVIKRIPNGIPERIPDGSTQGITKNTTISQNITVEKAEVIFDATHPDWGDFTVKLISPNGTESVLASPIPNPANSSESEKIVPDSPQWKFISLRHWGESSRGEWKLQVIDNYGNPLEGTWNSWKLNLYGSPIETRPGP
ncbi:S8 family serine peptidase [Microcoleus sp. AR_TQ3_B6]|uniref:S8 family serine peptidase n=1 Tax=Microcoleus sp. AR_TQ3_B6 TaxID=3055284 RepID=UPI002FD1C434